MPVAMTLPRRRCAVCRRWFHPERRAQASQQVCSPPCRTARRRAQARRRRAQDLAGHRDAERARQQACRAARAQAAAPPAPQSPSVASPGLPAGQGLSRAGLRAQVAVVMGEILEKMDSAAALSRASFQRDVAGILEGKLSFLGQARP